MQTAGMAGAQAELCAVHHGERRQQGHVPQERRRQRAQQQQVTADLPSMSTSCPPRWDETPFMFVSACVFAPWQGGEFYRGGSHGFGRCGQPAGPGAQSNQ